MRELIALANPEQTYREVNKGDGEERLMCRLTRFVEDSDLSFYQIALRLGVPSIILSMWLAGTARPNWNELDEIEKLLES